MQHCCHVMLMTRSAACWVGIVFCLPCALQDSATSLQYAAFFADCEHELSSITSGMRLVLVYNLVWVGALGTAPRLYKTSPAEVKLSRALTAWQAEIDAGGRQKRIALLLGEWQAASSACAANTIHATN